MATQTSNQTSPNDSPPLSHAQLNPSTPTTKVLNMVRRSHLPAHCHTISNGFHHSNVAFAIHRGTDPYQINTLDAGMGFRQTNARSIRKQSFSRLESYPNLLHREIWGPCAVEIGIPNS